MRGWGISFLIMGIIGAVAPRFGMVLLPFNFFGEYYYHSAIGCSIIGLVMIGVSFGMRPRGG